MLELVRHIDRQFRPSRPLSLFSWASSFSSPAGGEPVASTPGEKHQHKYVQFVSWGFDKGEGVQGD